MTEPTIGSHRKILVAVVAVLLVIVLGLFVWARAVFTGDAVRDALAAQMSRALGQPVTIARLSAGIFPRVTVELGDVRIGEPVRVRVNDLRVGTDLRALLSRRIEHATIRLDGARIELPLPPRQPGAPPDETRSWPVQIMSIDQIVLRNAEILSGGRTLRGDVDAMPRDGGFRVNASLAADGAKFAATGTITDVSGPVGDIALTAGTLNVAQLVDFASAFSTGSATGHPAPRARGPASSHAMNLGVSLDADRATIGPLVVEKLAGRARITADGVVLNPLGFNVFGGRYDGALIFDPAEAASGFHTQATVTNIDVAAATAFAGTPNVISGRLAGKLDCSGRAAGGAGLMPTIRGTARVDISNGTVRNLGLVRAVVIATSMRAGATGALAGTSRDEAFSRLGATLDIANGVLTTNDLRFESSNLMMTARGKVQMRSSTVDLAGNLQLSEALSQQAGRDLFRYTQESGRVTLPVTVSGPLAGPEVTIDVADLLKRGLRNAATEQIRKSLRDLFKK